MVCGKAPFELFIFYLRNTILLATARCLNAIYFDRTGIFVKIISHQRKILISESFSKPNATRLENPTYAAIMRAEIIQFKWDGQIIIFKT